MKRFENKNVLITGAASGIGRAAAFRIASEGGSLALLDRDEVKLSETVDELTSQGTRVVSATCDVSNFEQTGEAINSLVDQIGVIHSLSHNAGILRCYRTHEMTPAQWDEIISINLTGTFNVNRHALPHLLKNETSYLVNTSSIASYYRHPWASAYSATKGAIVSFTRSLFIEYFQEGLRANCVLPGSIDTPLARAYAVPKGANPELIQCLVPFKEPVMVSPESVAGTIAFLASDDAYHINGAEITVDGGKV